MLPPPLTPSPPYHHHTHTYLYSLVCKCPLFKRSCLLISTEWTCSSEQIKSQAALLTVHKPAGGHSWPVPPLHPEARIWTPPAWQPLRNGARWNGLLLPTRRHTHDAQQRSWSRGNLCCPAVSPGTGSMLPAPLGLRRESQSSWLLCCSFHTATESHLHCAILIDLYEL